MILVFAIAMDLLIDSERVLFIREGFQRPHGRCITYINESNLHLFSNETIFFMKNSGHNQIFIRRFSTPSVDTTKHTFEIKGNEFCYNIFGCIVIHKYFNWNTIGSHFPVYGVKCKTKVIFFGVNDIYVPRTVVFKAFDVKWKIEAG